MIIFEGMGKVFHGGEAIVEGGEPLPNKAKLSTENAGKGVFTDDLMKVEDIKNGYCTQFLINKNEGVSAAKMRAFAESNGDSVVCIEDDDVINLHVHTADPGKILSEAIKYGYLTNFKIENMHEQFLARQRQGKSLEKQASAEKKKSDPTSQFIYAAVDPSRDYGFVAVAAGEGLKAVFTDLAADAVVSGGQTMNPATEDILAAIQSVPAKTVFVLPNNKNIIMAAEQAQKLADRQVVVLPTRTVPMGITALLNFDPSANTETNTINMMAAADKVSTGLITYAARDSEYDGKRIKKGEIMLWRTARSSPLPTTSPRPPIVWHAACMKAAAKKAALAAIANGEADLVVGTHAVLGTGVELPGWGWPLWTSSTGSACASGASWPARLARPTCW